jgi:hypothetical protein
MWGTPQVATPEDPASARLGESVYSFIPRSIVGNLQDGINAEMRRLDVRGLPFWTFENRCVGVQKVSLCVCCLSFFRFPLLYTLSLSLTPSLSLSLSLCVCASVLRMCVCLSAYLSVGTCVCVCVCERERERERERKLTCLEGK